MQPTQRDGLINTQMLFLLVFSLSLLHMKKLSLKDCDQFEAYQQYQTVL